MERTIILTVDVAADPDRVFELLATTQGQRAFWTADCDVSDTKARFGFPQAPVDLLADLCGHLKLKPKSVLDLGAANGALQVAIQASIPTIKETAGIEISCSS